MKRLITSGLISSLFLFAGTAYAATLEVPADYATIQAAVDAADPGDTVNVAVGTYVENIVVNKPLILNGAGSGSVVDANGTGAAFQVLANDVTINAFKIQNGAGALNAGIWMGDPQNVVISNNIFTNNMFGIWADCGGNCVIENNLFDGNNVTGGSGSGGISADSTVGLTISNNEFKNEQEGNPILLQAAGPNAHTNVVVSSNSIHDNVYSGVYALGISGGTFSGNTITAPDATGLSFSGGNDTIAITNNTITNSARGVRIEDAGYGLGPNSNFTFSGNTFSGNTEYNVAVLPGGYTGTPFNQAPVITLSGDAHMIVFSSNNFTDPGASASDDFDSNVQVIVTGSVSKQPGTYTLTYNATDSFGAAAAPATRTVEVKSASGGGGGGGGGNGATVNNSGPGRAIVALPSQARGNPNGQVLGAFTDNSIEGLKAQLALLIQQLIDLLQQQLAAAISAGNY